MTAQISDDRGMGGRGAGSIADTEFLRRRGAEPPLNEMLADPLVRQLMSRDRISEPALRALLDEARRRLHASRAG